jgi:hypothetical protein
MTRVLASYNTQDAAKEDLMQYVAEDQKTALNQALNQAYSGEGLNSGEHEIVDFGNQHVLHASAGKIGTSRTVTLFYFFDDGKFRLIALGQHEGNGYRIDKVLGQADQPFQKGRLVSATGWG